MSIFCLLRPSLRRNCALSRLSATLPVTGRVVWLLSARLGIIGARRTTTTTTTTTPSKKNEDTSKTTPRNSALDQSILELSTKGPSYLPRLWRDFMASNDVCYLLANDAEPTAHDALTLPDRHGNLHPSLFSSSWTAERYLRQHGHDLPANTTIQPTSARTFLQQTRPATVLLNPPVFTLTPDLIEDLLRGKLEHVSHENEELSSAPVQRPLTNHHVYYEKPSPTLSVERLQLEITEFLEQQSVVVAAYLLRKQGDDQESLVVACLCRMTHVHEFQQDVRNDMQRVLSTNAITGQKDNQPQIEHSILCLNNELADMELFSSIIDKQSPFFLNLGLMSNAEFTLFVDKISVGPAPPIGPRDRQALLHDLTQDGVYNNDGAVTAVYQIVYQIAGYPGRGPKIGTFWETATMLSDRSKPSPQACLHQGWGSLHDLPPEMATYIQNHVEPVIVAK